MNKETKYELQTPLMGFSAGEQKTPIEWMRSIPEEYNTKDHIFFLGQCCKKVEEPVNVKEAMANLDVCIKKASKNWKGVNTDEFIEELRGEEPCILDSEEFNLLLLDHSIQLSNKSKTALKSFLRENKDRIL